MVLPGARARRRKGRPRLLGLDEGDSMIAQRLVLVYPIIYRLSYWIIHGDFPSSSWRYPVPPIAEWFLEKIPEIKMDDWGYPHDSGKLDIDYLEGSDLLEIDTFLRLET